MELTNEFIIDRDVEETWKILNDLEFIAPCMPGAQLTEIEGDEYRGLVKIKVGPITANYKGKASFIEQDAVNKVAKLKAEGRDPRQGNANAMVTAEMESAGENKTNVKIHTDLGLSGKIASFGRGAIEDVSKKILGQFTDNLRDKLENAEDIPGLTTKPPAEADQSVANVPAPVSPSGAETGAVTGATGGSPEPARSGIRKIEGPEAEAVDLLAVSGASVMKRVVPTVGGLALLAAIIYWIVR
ncbi:MAG: SRPBCC family protein [Acidimicrobiales bacterium]